MSKWEPEWENGPDDNIPKDIWEPGAESSPTLRFLKDLMEYFLLILAGLGGIILSFYLITWLWGYLMYLFSEMARILNPPEIKLGQGLGLDSLKPNIPKVMIAPDYDIPKVMLENPKRIQIQPKLDFSKDRETYKIKREQMLTEYWRTQMTLDSEQEVLDRYKIKLDKYLQERDEELLNKQ